MTDATNPTVGGEWTFEVHELSEGFSAIVYDERGFAVADHLTERGARVMVEAHNARARLRATITKATGADQ
jgi:hypothetical protein